MPQFVNFSITPTGPVQITSTNYQVQVQIYSDDNPAVLLADYTGENALNIPGDLNKLTVEQQGRLLDRIVNDFIYMIAKITY